MGKADERNHEHEVFERVTDRIVDGLRNGTDPVVMSSSIAEEHNLDQRTVFKWIQVLTEQKERRRRRYASIGAVLIWIGAISLGLGILGSVFSWNVASGRSAGLVWGVAAIGLIGGIGIVRSATRWAYRSDGGA